MATNYFGQIFRITTWGESHGPAIGVVIDGCPAGIEIDVAEINAELAWRAPGKTSHTSPRQESDHAEILSGVFEGQTTGAPITIQIANRDANADAYHPIKNLLRPGHANYTYLEKYGVFDYRGGGRASGRETACRVAAGVIAKKLLKYQAIEIVAYLKQIENIKVNSLNYQTLQELKQAVLLSPVFCPDPQASQAMQSLIQQLKVEGDSIGGIVEFIVHALPPGFGDPVYEKLEANLAKALMGLPASKGFEIGSGFQAVHMRGSEHNDPFVLEQGRVCMTQNCAGGTLGGISTGMPLIGRVVFKPTSSIQKPQSTLTTTGENATFQLPEGSRHDPCVAIRAVPVVEAMVALVLADALLMNRCVKV